jgi:thiamine biosynthesis protein ThiI
MAAILVRYSEIGLKGKNRRFFERKLCDNIKVCLKKQRIVFGSIVRKRGRIVVDAPQAAIDCLRLVFGISSLSHAQVCPLDIDVISRLAIGIARDSKAETFRISAQRLNKQFQLKSPEIERIVGSAVAAGTAKRVDLVNPCLTIWIEILDMAYVFNEKISGFEGLPVGTQGRVLCAMNSDHDVLAALMLMNRGCTVSVHRPKVDYSLIERYSIGFPLKLVALPEDMDGAVAQSNSKGYCVGQAFEEFTAIDTQCLVLRPLIGFSEKEIKERLEMYTL